MVSFRHPPKIQTCLLGLWIGWAPVIAECQAAESIQRTWERGQNRVPDIALREGQYRTLNEIRDNPDSWKIDVAQNKLKPGTKLPAVIYLHGCAGNTAGYQWWNKFNELGYAFFAPNSLARPRKPLCGKGQMRSHRIPMRTAELRYALQQLSTLDWIDQTRIILMGSSEGAQAASRYSGDEFVAVVLSATDCRFSGGSPSAPAGTPVLSMVGSKDDKGGGSGCNIRRKVGASKRIVIEGAYHKLGGNEEARQALEQFLKSCCTTLEGETD